MLLYVADIKMSKEEFLDKRFSSILRRVGDFIAWSCRKRVAAPRLKVQVAAVMAAVSG